MDKNQLKKSDYSYFEHRCNNGRKLMVFLHGFPDNPYIWLHQWRHFKSNYSLLAPYAPGTCSDDKYDNRDLGLDRYCEIVYQQIQSLPFDKREEIILVAHDLGGAVLGELQRRLPEVKHAILINTLTFEQFLKRSNRPLQWMKSFYMVLFQIPWLNEKNLQMIYPYLRKLAEKLGRPFDSEISPMLDYLTLRNLEFYRRLAREIPAKWSRPTTKVPVRALFIWGEQDPFLLPPVKNEIDFLFETYEYFPLLNAGHWVFVTDFHKCNARIDKFLGEAI